jgi:hypothetical protein
MEMAFGKTLHCSKITLHYLWILGIGFMADDSLLNCSTWIQTEPPLVWLSLNFLPEVGLISF